LKRFSVVVTGQAHPNDAPQLLINRGGFFMNDFDSGNQLKFVSRPYAAWIIGGVLIISPLFIFAQGTISLVFGILLGIGLLVLLLTPVVTISADRFTRVLKRSNWAVLYRKSVEIPFNEITNFDIETIRTHSSKHGHQTRYRLVVVKTNGEKQPLEDMYGNFYDDKARKARALSQFLNLPGWEDKPTNLFQTAMQSQVEETAIPALSKEGVTSGVNWKISVHTVGGKPITRWISEDYTCPGSFLLIAQKPVNSQSFGGGGILGNLMTMVYQQILGMYGFLPSDTPGFATATPVPAQDPRFDSNFGTLTNDQHFGRSLLNTWTIAPFISWAAKYPMKTVSSNDQVGQLAVLYSPRGVQAVILGSLPATEFDELIEIGVAVVKSQGGGKPA
jgi:hypothetical protein